MLLSRYYNSAFELYTASLFVESFEEQVRESFVRRLRLDKTDAIVLTLLFLIALTMLKTISLQIHFCMYL